jgi:hypothetical protein
VLGRVVPFETLDDPAGLSGSERLIKRRRCVGIQVVLNQHDLLGLGEVDVAEVAQNLGIVDGRATFRNLDPRLRGGRL